MFWWNRLQGESFLVFCLSRQTKTKHKNNAENKCMSSQVNSTGNGSDYLLQINTDAASLFLVFQALTHIANTSKHLHLNLQFYLFFLDMNALFAPPNIKWACSCLVLYSCLVNCCNKFVSPVFHRQSDPETTKIWCHSMFVYISWTRKHPCVQHFLVQLHHGRVGKYERTDTEKKSNNLEILVTN